MMARKKFFIAGTDTDVGKTFVACALLEKFRQLGLETVAVKPVAAGCEATPQGLRNDDALHLQSAMTAQLPYDQVNPIAFEPAIAPHIAAMREGRRLSVSRLEGFCNGVLMRTADVALVEGAGGWRVPLNPRETLADLAKTLNIPVILVVGMRLGCINHALLTAEAIARDGLRLAGWVANRADPDMSCYKENVMTLTTLLDAPLLGEIPHSNNHQTASQYLSVEALLAPPINND